MNFTVTSTKCSKAGHREFRVRGESPALKQDAEWLIEYLESSVLNGTNFTVGETIQMGWMINRVEEGDGGLLIISEPDFEHLPIAFIPSVTKTLFHLRIQKDTADSLGLLDQLTLPSVCDAVSVTANWALSSRLQMFRIEPVGAHSGWVVEEVHSGEHDERNLGQSKLISLYELALVRPEFVPFFALPQRIRISGIPTKNPEIFLADERIEFAPTSFLARYLDRDRSV